MRSSLALLMTTVALGGCAHAEPAESSASEIVGGTVDPTSHPAAGYLIAKVLVGPHAGEIVRSVCGATLVADKRVITSASCIEEQLVVDRTILGVGFGEGQAGPTYELEGTWREAIHPQYFKVWQQGPDAPPFYIPDSRRDVAVLKLKSSPASITPLGIASVDISVGTRATIIGYGRNVAATNASEFDTVATMLDHPERFPMTRHSAELEIKVFRTMIDAAPTTSGGICMGDMGGGLLLSDGKLAGVFARYSSDVLYAWQMDGIHPCRGDAGSQFVNVQSALVRDFVAERLLP